MIIPGISTATAAPPKPLTRFSGGVTVEYFKVGSGAGSDYANWAAFETAKKGDITATGTPRIYVIEPTTPVASLSATDDVTISAGWTTDENHFLVFRGDGLFATGFNSYTVADLGAGDLVTYFDAVYFDDWHSGQFIATSYTPKVYVSGCYFKNATHNMNDETGTVAELIGIQCETLYESGGDAESQVKKRITVGAGAGGWHKQGGSTVALTDGLFVRKAGTTYTYYYGTSASKTVNGVWDNGGDFNGTGGSANPEFYNCTFGVDVTPHPGGKFQNCISHKVPEVVDPGCDYNATAAVDGPVNSARNSSYRWTLSASGTSEYYLELAAGGDPGISTDDVDVVFENGSAMTAGTLGTLAAGEWSYGDNDTLGFTTIYVRLADSSDPDGKAVDWVEYQETNASLWAGPNGRTGVTFDFVDAANGDYRLKETDTGARGIGRGPDSPSEALRDYYGRTRLPESWDAGAFTL